MGSTWRVWPDGSTADASSDGGLAAFAAASAEPAAQPAADESEEEEEEQEVIDDSIVEFLTAGARAAVMLCALRSRPAIRHHARDAAMPARRPVR